MNKQSFKNNLRPVIYNIEQYTAGKSIQEIADKYNINPKQIIKLGSNENVIGSSPLAQKAISNIVKKINLYPEVTSDSLRNKLKKIHRLKNSSVFIGNGMDQIFEMLARLFLNNGDETIISTPTFSCYELVTLWTGARPRLIPLNENFQLDTKLILKTINKKTKIIFICSPNNPTGNLINEKDIIEIITKTDKIVFLDEAYIEFSPGKSLVHLVDKYPNLIIGRTFSKIFGLAGLRVGYAFINNLFANYYLNSITPFVVSKLGQVAGFAALDDKKFIQKSISLVTKGKKQLYKGFSDLGIKYLKSDANFIAINTGERTKEITQKLMQKGIIVRDCTRFRERGKNLIRITIGTETQNKKVLQELKKII